MKKDKKYDLEVKISKEHERIIIPTKREDDAGYDLYCDIDWLREEHKGELQILPQETVIIPTGIRTVINKNWYIQIQERGSTGIKAMKYGAGVIDSSYRGVHNVVITNCSNKPIIIYDVEKSILEEDGKTYYPSNKGVAQFVILPVPKAKFITVTKENILNDKTDRGEGKLGSSGK